MKKQASKNGVDDVLNSLYSHLSGVFTAFMKAVLKERVFKYIKCPACEDPEGYKIDGEQIKLKSDLGILYCQNCGFGIICKVTSESKIEIEEFPRKNQPTFVLLRLTNHPEPIYIVVRSSKRFNKATKKFLDEEDIEDAFMESDQVMFDFVLDPVTYLQNIVCVLKKDFDQPNQFLEYVATAEITDFTSDFEENYFREKFKHYLKG